MIHACIPNQLSADAARRAEQMLVGLASFQAEVNQAPTYAERVGAAKKQWDSKRKQALFTTIRELLQAMCPGNARCMFCEDSAATEIEHFRPKSLYPELVFEWANFLYACGECNGPGEKGTRLEIRRPDGGIVELGRAKSKPALPPEEGEPLLINPRYEDPLDLIELDLSTGFLSPRRSAGFAHDRAVHTIGALGLNEREHLVVARRNTYVAAKALLEEIGSRLSGGAPPDDIERRKTAILRHTHRTVWEEMKRQRTRYSELRELFEKAPAAAAW